MNIYITPTNEQRLRTWADSERSRSMSGLINDLLDGFLSEGASGATYYKDNQVEKKVAFTEKNIAGSDEKVDTFPTIPDINKRTWQTILYEINAYKDKIDSADHMNQDPDYWDMVNGWKAHVQDLWDEYNILKGGIV